VCHGTLFGFLRPNSAPRQDRTSHTGLSCNISRIVLRGDYISNRLVRGLYLESSRAGIISRIALCGDYISNRLVRGLYLESPCAGVIPPREDAITQPRSRMLRTHPLACDTSRVTGMLARTAATVEVPCRIRWNRPGHVPQSKILHRIGVVDITAEHCQTHDPHHPAAIVRWTDLANHAARASPCAGSDSETSS
jgi:hypothetical protein